MFQYIGLSRKFRYFCRFGKLAYECSMRLNLSFYQLLITIKVHVVAIKTVSTIFKGSCFASYYFRIYRTLRTLSSWNFYRNSNRIGTGLPREELIRFAACEKFNSTEGGPKIEIQAERSIYHRFDFESESARSHTKNDFQQETRHRHYIRWKVGKWRIFEDSGIGGRLCSFNEAFVNE